MSSDDPVRYREQLDGLVPASLEGFFVGWPDPPSVDTLLRLLRGSYAVVLAVDEGPEGERVVGFVSAVSDGVLSAYIPLLEVLPGWQRRGIGAELVRRMQARLSHLYMVDLCCDAGLVPFYERLGFTRGVGMLQRNYEHQSGRTSSA